MKCLAALVAVLSVTNGLSATSVVIVTTRHGIVIGTDNKAILSHPHSQAVPSLAHSQTKLFLIENRIAVAQAGVDLITDDQGAALYSYESLIEYLRVHSSPSITVPELVSRIEDRVSQIFDGFNVLLKEGVFKKEYLPWPDNGLLRFYVAGYDGGHPVAYTITLEIDWALLALKPPAVSIVCPDPHRKNLCLHWVGGTEHGIKDFLNGVKTEVVTTAIKRMPEEIAALSKDSDITVTQSLKLAHGMLDVEVCSNPATIGYPLDIITMRPTAIRKHRYQKGNCN